MQRNVWAVGGSVAELAVGQREFVGTLPTNSAYSAWRCGPEIYFGSVQESRDAAPMRISFTQIPDPELEQD